MKLRDCFDREKNTDALYYMSGEVADQVITTLRMMHDIEISNFIEDRIRYTITAMRGSNPYDTIRFSITTSKPYPGMYYMTNNDLYRMKQVGLDQIEIHVPTDTKEITNEHRTERHTSK